MSLFDEVENRVRQRAYEIWQREGCPEGREADHWALAKEEIAIEDNQSQTLVPNPSQGGDDTVVHPEPVEPLLAAESLEEDIGGPTNQSDEQPLPKRTRTRRTVAPGDAEPAPAPSGTAGAAKTTRTRKAKSKE